MTLRVLIADDEAPARRKLVRLLADESGVEVVAEASTGLDAVDLASMTHPDVVFLDIQMPDLDGLGVAEALLREPSPPAIIFVTAYDEYAVRAFDVSALDYLLKPYDRERFARALERARRAPPTVRLSENVARAVAELRDEQRYVKRLLVPNEGRSFFVACQEISRIESDGNNVVLHARASEYALRGTLDAMEARLDPAHFARVHRSHLINFDHVAEIRPWFHGDQRILMKDGSEVPWSRRYAGKRKDAIV
ncbi:MAG: response regulator transcription factor [Candidatus Eremiobacteraeota bacterium]|nr:response regulator transcription factor [Candidatus Eremiobacteraeota bacterium]